MTSPVKNPYITQYWCENKEKYQAAFGILSHNGIDFLSTERGYGADILATHNGVVDSVIWNGEHSTKGNGIYLKNLSSEFETVYWHLSKVLVTKGQNIKQGDKIGEMGNSGWVFPEPTPDRPYNGTHLHFAIRPLNSDGSVKDPHNGYDGYVNPEIYLSMGKIVGDNKTKKQYVFGADNQGSWIYDTSILEWLHKKGFINKDLVEWRDDVVETELDGETVALIK